MSTIKLKVVLKNKELELANILEYVCGFKYLYVRFDDRMGSTISIPRSQIVEVWSLGHKPHKINLKKIKET